MTKHQCLKNSECRMTKRIDAIVEIGGSVRHEGFVTTHPGHALLGPKNSICLFRVPSCPSWITSSLAHFVYGIDQRQDVVYWSLWKNSVTQIEDVAGSARRRLQKAQGPGSERRAVSKEEQRI